MDKTRDEKRSGYIKKIGKYIQKGDIQGLSKGVIRIAAKIFRSSSVKNVNRSFHIHFNIKGGSVKKDLEDIGFQIKDEWYQLGRFYYPYHLIVGKKK